jgi:hypothetical protein
VRNKNNKDKGKKPKFEKEKIDKHKKRYPSGGVKKCLRCDEDFLSNDVITTRICVNCSRLINKEWLPDVHRSGYSSPNESTDEWF